MLSATNTNGNRSGVNKPITSPLEWSDISLGRRKVSEHFAHARPQGHNGQSTAPQFLQLRAHSTPPPLAAVPNIRLSFHVFCICSAAQSISAPSLFRLQMHRKLACLCHTLHLSTHSTHAPTVSIKYICYASQPFIVYFVYLNHCILDNPLSLFGIFHLQNTEQGSIH